MQETKVAVRVASVEDAVVCGKICYDAFFAISQRHGFPCDLPGVEHATGLLSMMFASPDCWYP